MASIKTKKIKKQTALFNSIFHDIQLCFWSGRDSSPLWSLKCTLSLFECQIKTLHIKSFNGRHFTQPDFAKKGQCTKIIFRLLTHLPNIFAPPRQGPHRTGARKEYISPKNSKLKFYHKQGFVTTAVCIILHVYSAANQ